MSAFNNNSQLHGVQPESGFLENPVDLTTSGPPLPERQWWERSAFAAQETLKNSGSWPGGPENGPGGEGTISGLSGHGNTDSSSSHVVEKDHPSPIPAGNWDWIETTVSGRFTERFASDYEPLLEQARLAAFEGLPDHQVMVGPPAEPGETEDQKFTRQCSMRIFDVWKSGFHWQNTFFPWTIERDGIRISVGRSTQKETCPICKVQISSLKLMRDGEAAWFEAKQYLMDLGLMYHSDLVYRMDICLDLPGVPVTPFCQAIDRGEVISRIRSKCSTYKTPQGEYTGVSLGDRKRCRLNIYDKLESLQTEFDKDLADAKLYELIVRSYGILPSHATRVEFQMRGSWVRSKWTIRGVEEYFDAKRALVEYLTTNLCRLVDGPVDRENKNQQRAEVSPLWAEVTEGFTHWAGEMLSILKRKPASDPSRERIERQVARSLSTLVALYPDYSMDDTGLAYLIVAAVQSFGPDKYELLRLVKEKHAKWLRSGSYPSYVDGRRPPHVVGQFSPVQGESYNMAMANEELAEINQRHLDW